MKPRHQLLILISSLSHGGAEIQAISWAKHLKNLGIAVHVGALFAGPFETTLRSEGIEYTVLTRRPKVIIWRPLSFLIGLIRLYVLQRKIRPENIVAFLFIETLMVSILESFNLTKSKIFFGRRASFGYGGRSKLQDYLLRKGYGKATKVFSNSESNNDAAERDGVDLQKIILIENFLRSDLPEARKDVLDFVTNQQVRIMNVGNLTEVKNQHIAIKTIRNLHDKGVTNRIILDIYGEGELSNELSDYARCLGVELVLLGSKENPWLEIGGYFAYLHSSNSEGSSNSLWEAVAMGLPVVTTNCGDAMTLKRLAGDSVFVASNEDEILQHLKSLFEDYSSISAAALKNAKIVREYRSNEKICQAIRIMLKL